MPGTWELSDGGDPAAVESDVPAGPEDPYDGPELPERGVAQLGSALALGARGRGFESRHPDSDPATRLSATPTHRHPDMR